MTHMHTSPELLHGTRQQDQFLGNGVSPHLFVHCEVSRMLTATYQVLEIVSGHELHSIKFTCHST